MLQFQATVVELLIGILFVLISGSVEPSRVGALLGKGVALVAVMVLVLRPLVVALSTWGSGLRRAPAGWIATAIGGHH